MRCILGFTLLSILFSATVMTAQNSQTFDIAAPARVENIQLLRGKYEVSWSAPSKSRVTFTIRTEDKDTFKILSRVIEGRQYRTGVSHPSWTEFRTCRRFTSAMPNSNFKTG
jgi:hypothetical protein